MSKGLRKFYEGQNEILDGFQEVDEILDNARAKAATGELTPLITVKKTSLFLLLLSFFPDQDFELNSREFDRRTLLQKKNN